MLLTGHVNLNKLNNTNIKDFGIKLEYEWFERIYKKGDRWNFMKK